LTIRHPPYKRLYIASDFFLARKLSPSGIITSLDLILKQISVDAADRVLVSFGCLVTSYNGAFTVFPPFAGTGSCGFFGDGGAAAAANMTAGKIATKASGKIIVSDYSNHLVRKLTPTPTRVFTLTTSPRGYHLSNYGAGFPVLEIRLDGTGIATWTATVTPIAPPGINWLSLSATSGTGTSYVFPTAAAGLQPGFYAANITISSPQAINGSVVVPVSLQVNYPAPSLTSIAPSSAMVGSDDIPVLITGTNFVQGAMVQIGETILSTSFSNSTFISVVVPASILATPGVYPFTVFNPSPGGGVTASIPFAVIPEGGFKRRGQITSQ
jgi:hypothetical protein